MKDMRALFLASLLLCGAALLPAQAPKSLAFHDSVQPFLAKNCYACHNSRLMSGNLNLEAYTSEDSVMRDRERFETVLRKLKAGEMPPPGSPRPDDGDLKAVEGWLRSQFDHADASAKPVAGRVTARRLNRAEYNNTVRDLLGVDFKPADDFPQDDSGYGFDNIGDALSLPPVLMEKYFSAAEEATHIALFGQQKIQPTVTRHQPPYREGNDGGGGARFAALIKYTLTDYDETGLTMPSSLHALHTFPAEGDYEIRISPEGNRPRPSEPFAVAVWIDGKIVSRVMFESTTNSTGMEGLDKVVTVHAPAGEHWVAVSGLRLFEGLPARYGAANPTKQPDIVPPAQPAVIAAGAAVNARGGRGNRPPAVTDVSFRVNFIEISGPFHPVTGPSAASGSKIFVCHEKTEACAHRILAQMARRAYRRAVKPGETAQLMGVFDSDRKRGASFEQSLAVGIEAMMVSPNFLFRVESDPAPGPNGDREHEIGQFELASRLSYFLWSSMPDEDLLRAADSNTLRNPAVLKAQVTRMLRDPKAKALVENFGGQWLEFRKMESVKPDANIFRAFNDYLRISMTRETSLFFENLLKTDGSVVDFLNGKYSFLNEELARYYAIPNVKGPEFRRVELGDGSHRAGVLTQGSVLIASSYATRTSVVLRGKWVLENLMNAPVPPPPPNVPTLDETAVGASLTLRQSMEKHRTNPACASCHARMDPIGFGLENFDGIGRWRTEDGTLPIDASGKLPDGRTFTGPEGLRTILTAGKDAFVEGMTAKMLTYALGRGLESYDETAVRKIAAQVAKDDYRISSMILGIVNSVPFEQRKGNRASL